MDLSDPLKITGLSLMVTIGVMLVAVLGAFAYVAVAKRVRAFLSRQQAEQERKKAAQSETIARRVAGGESNAAPPKPRLLPPEEFVSPTRAGRRRKNTLAALDEVGATNKMDGKLVGVDPEADTVRMPQRGQRPTQRKRWPGL